MDRQRSPPPTSTIRHDRDSCPSGQVQPQTLISPSQSGGGHGRAIRRPTRIGKPVQMRSKLLAVRFFIPQILSFTRRHPDKAGIALGTRANNMSRAQRKRASRIGGLSQSQCSVVTRLRGSLDKADDLLLFGHQSGSSLELSFLMCRCRRRRAPASPSQA